MRRNPNPPPGPGPGRPKGVQNKITRCMREIMREAFEQAGGVEYLVQQSKAEPVAFMALVGKIIPQEIKGDINGNFTVTWQD